MRPRRPKALALSDRTSKSHTGNTSITLQKVGRITKGVAVVSEFRLRSPRAMGAMNGQPLVLFCSIIHSLHSLGLKPITPSWQAFLFGGVLLPDTFVWQRYPVVRVG
jgi:hypothetical protein